MATTRRSFFKALAAVPFLGALVPAFLAADPVSRYASGGVTTIDEAMVQQMLERIMRQCHCSADQARGMLEAMAQVYGNPHHGLPPGSGLPWGQQPATFGEPVKVRAISPETTDGVRLLTNGDTLATALRRLADEVEKDVALAGATSLVTKLDWGVNGCERHSLAIEFFLH